MAAARRWLSNISALRAEMQARPHKAIVDVLSPMPSHLLNVALSDVLPPECDPAHFDRARPDPPSAAVVLPQGHHLVYFPLQLPPSQLLADGTDPAHAPGAAFGRRMWAGGSVHFAPGWADSLRLDGRRTVCVESIGDVALRSDKVFVDVWRRYGLAEAPDVPLIEEKRSLVFMTGPPARDRSRVVKGGVLCRLATAVFLGLANPPSPLHARVYLPAHSLANAALSVQRADLQCPCHPLRPPLQPGGRGPSWPARTRPPVASPHVLCTTTPPAR